MDFIHKKTKNVTHVYNEEHIKFYRNNPNFEEVGKSKGKAEKSASSNIKKKKENKNNDIKNEE